MAAPRIKSGGPPSTSCYRTPAMRKHRRFFDGPRMTSRPAADLEVVSITDSAILHLRSAHPFSTRRMAKCRGSRGWPACNAVSGICHLPIMIHNREAIAFPMEMRHHQANESGSGRAWLWLRKNGNCHRST